MREFEWSSMLRALSRAAVFSFGIALCLLLIAAIAWPMLAGSERAYGPNEARVVFSIAFLVALLGIAATAGYERNALDSAESGSTLSDWQISASSSPLNAPFRSS